MYLSCKCLHGMFVWAKIIMTTVLQEKGTVFESVVLVTTHHILLVLVERCC